VRLGNADKVLMLLRAGDLSAAEELVGKPITRCPAWVPQWPPLPVASRRSEPRVVRVGRNPCLPTTDAFQRYKVVRVGMTKKQLLARGLSHRDIRIWVNGGHVEFSK
jgi:hypothetical protein